MEKLSRLKDNTYMFKRARISFLIALLAATAGFLGLLNVAVAQIIFCGFAGFAVLSTAFGLFEGEQEVPSTEVPLQPNRLSGP